MLFDLLTMDLSTIFQEHSCCVNSGVTVLCMLKPNQAKQQERTIRWNLSMTLATYSCDRSLPIRSYPTLKSRYCVDLVAQYPAMFSCPPSLRAVLPAES